jgi:hypothetical protein
VSAVPDNWSYVLAAYGVSAVTLIAYWRYLSARARALGHDRRARSRGA